MSESHRSPSTTLGAPLVKVRAASRHPVIERGCPMAAVFVGEEVHTAAVRDLSVGGVGLLLDRPLAPDTELAGKLINAGRVVCCTRLMVVVHATRQPEGGYLIGCAFTTPLTPEQLRALLG